MRGIYFTHETPVNTAVINTAGTSDVIFTQRLFRIEPMTTPQFDVD